MQTLFADHARRGDERDQLEDLINELELEDWRISDGRRRIEGAERLFLETDRGR